MHHNTAPGFCNESRAQLLFWVALADYQNLQLAVAVQKGYNLVTNSRRNSL